MRLSKQKLALLIVLASTTLLAGCGGQAYREASPVSPAPGGDTGGTGGSGGGGTGGGSGSGSGTGGSSFIPGISESFELHGNTETFTSQTISTDSVLRVKVLGGSAIGNVGGAPNFKANYGCISYTVTVLGQTIQTKPLSVEGGSDACPGAVTEQVLDFSNRLQSGHGTVQVKISKPQTDFKYRTCLTYPALYNYSCELYKALSPVYEATVDGVRQANGVSGTIEIEVNGTSI